MNFGAKLKVKRLKRPHLRVAANVMGKLKRQQPDVIEQTREPPIWKINTS